MTEYLIKSTLCLAVFYLVFVLLFKGSRNFRLNRMVLLFSILFSLLVPLLQLPLISAFPEELNAGSDLLTKVAIPEFAAKTPQQVDELSDTVATRSRDISSLLLVVYFLVAALFLARFILNLVRFIIRIRRSEQANFLGYQVVLFDHPTGPFTFFSSICIPKARFQDGTLEEELLLHEMAHKKQRHSIDVTIIELLQVIFWFQPFIYLYKRLIKANHEYLADDFVMRSGVTFQDYSYKLLHHTFPDKMSGFVSGFNHLLIKNRLIMLSRFQPKKPLAYRFLLLIPIAMLLFLTTAFQSSGLAAALSDQVENGLDTPGTLYANSIEWTSNEHKINLRGKDIRVKHGENDFRVDGRASYLGEVYYFVFNGQPAAFDTRINVEGKQCSVIKLSPQAATKKYGAKGRQGAVEINVVE